MKFLIVVIFAMNVNSYDGGRDLFIFTQPTYEDKLQCEADITDPLVYPGLVEKLVLEYRQLKKIESVICVEEQELKRVLEGHQETSV